MKVILQRDVAKIGKKHQIVNVPDGLAMNKLLPKGDAKPATSENLKAIEQIKASKEALASAEEERFFVAKEALKNKTIEINGLKHDNGHLFAALKPEQIQDATKAMAKLESNWINIQAPIKTAGKHTLQLSCGRHKAEMSIVIN